MNVRKTLMVSLEMILGVEEMEKRVRKQERKKQEETKWGEREKKEKHAKTEQCGKGKEEGGTLTFLIAVAETQRASGITMTIQTQTSRSGVCVRVCLQKRILSNYMHSEL